MRNRLGWSDSGLVLAAVEAGHLVVHDTLKLDGDGSLLGDGQLLVKGDGGSLGLGIVGEVLGVDGLRGFGMLDRDGGVEELDLEGVDDDFLGRLGDFSVDTGVGVSLRMLEAWRRKQRSLRDGALVGPGVKLEVRKSQIVVSWLHIIRENLAVSHLVGILGSGVCRAASKSCLG